MLLRLGQYAMVEWENKASVLGWVGSDLDHPANQGEGNGL